MPPIKNPTQWSNSDVKNPTAYNNADTKSKTSWANADTKNPTLATSVGKNDTGWHEGLITNPGNLALFTNNLRTLMSNDGRTLVTAGYYPADKNTTTWSQIG